MSIRRKLNLACTITRRVEDDVDEYNDVTTVETTATTKCYLEQTSTAEDVTGRNVADTSWLLLLPADAVIGNADAVTVDDFGTFEVVGESWPVWNPRTHRVSHLEARLRRTA